MKRRAESTWRKFWFYSMWSASRWVRLRGPCGGAGLDFRYVRGYAGERVPVDIGDAPGLIVMGGPMGVYERDRYPYLGDEMRLIAQAVARGVPTLGVCLGS